MYTFTDKGGRSVTLRPEYTPSVARAIIEHRLDLQPEPLRFYFIGPMFRYDKPQKGRYRQFHQIDIEVFGGKRPGHRRRDHRNGRSLLLKKLNVEETEILVNSVGCRNCRPAYLTGPARRSARKVRGPLCPDCQRKIKTNPLRIFDCKVEACRELAEDFPEITGYLCRGMRRPFRRFASYLDLYGIHYRVEPRLVRGIDYYTKTTFEISSSRLGAQNSILGGGRYDDMMKEFGGPDICGIGFAMGVERLLSVAELVPAGDKFLYLAYMGEEAKREGHRAGPVPAAHGLECLLEFKERGLKSQLGRASKLGASWALIIGEEEIRKGRYQLKEWKRAPRSKLENRTSSRSSAGPIPEKALGTPRAAKRDKNGRQTIDKRAEYIEDDLLRSNPAGT